MKRELIFEDVENRILGILGEKIERKTIIMEEGEEENEEPMGAEEEAGEEAEMETPEEEEEEAAAGDVDLENMSYEDKMSLVLEIIDSFEDDEEQSRFVDELKAELEGDKDEDFE